MQIQNTLGIGAALPRRLGALPTSLAAGARLSITQPAVRGVAATAGRLRREASANSEFGDAARSPYARTPPGTAHTPFSAPAPNQPHRSDEPAPLVRSRAVTARFACFRLPAKERNPNLSVLSRHSLTGGVAAWPVAPRVAPARSAPLEKRVNFSSRYSTRERNSCKIGALRAILVKSARYARSTWSSGALRASQHCLTEVSVKCFFCEVGRNPATLIILLVVHSRLRLGSLLAPDNHTRTGAAESAADGARHSTHARRQPPALRHNGHRAST